MFKLFGKKSSNKATSSSTTPTNCAVVRDGAITLVPCAVNPLTLAPQKSAFTAPAARGEQLFRSFAAQDGSLNPRNAKLTSALTGILSLEQQRAQSMLSGFNNQPAPIPEEDSSTSQQEDPIQTEPTRPITEQDEHDAMLALLAAYAVETTTAADVDTSEVLADIATDELIENLESAARARKSAYEAEGFWHKPEQPPPPFWNNIGAPWEA